MDNAVFTCIIALINWLLSSSVWIIWLWLAREKTTGKIREIEERRLGAGFVFSVDGTSGMDGKVNEKS